MAMYRKIERGGGVVEIHDPNTSPSLAGFFLWVDGQWQRVQIGLEASFEHCTDRLGNRAGVAFDWDDPDSAAYRKETR